MSEMVAHSQRSLSHHRNTLNLPQRTKPVSLEVLRKQPTTPTQLVTTHKPTLKNVGPKKKNVLPSFYRENRARADSCPEKGPMSFKKRTPGNRPKRQREDLIKAAQQEARKQKNQGSCEKGSMRRGGQEGKRKGRLASRVNLGKKIRRRQSRRRSSRNACACPKTYGVKHSAVRGRGVPAWTTTGPVGSTGRPQKKKPTQSQTSRTLINEGGRHSRNRGGEIE